MCCWLLFACGVVTHLLAPNLQRKDNAFVIPANLTSGQGNLRPDVIVARERRMQLIAAVLTVSGALGLGVLYRGVLFHRGSTAGSKGAERGRHGDLEERNVPQG